MTMKKVVNVSKQYPKKTLHAADSLLFCTSCNVTLDHTRKGTIHRRLLTPLHTQIHKSIDETNRACTKNKLHNKFQLRFGTKQ